MKMGASNIIGISQAEGDRNMENNKFHHISTIDHRIKNPSVLLDDYNRTILGSLKRVSEWLVSGFYLSRHARAID